MPHAAMISTGAINRISLNPFMAWEFTLSEAEGDHVGGFNFHTAMASPVW